MWQGDTSRLTLNAGTGGGDELQGSRDRWFATLWGKTAALMLVAALASACAAASAQGAVHVFEPVRSLTGDCSESALDPVPDPGPCPGVKGTDHPNAAFLKPSVTLDSHGDIYVANLANSEGRIDVFSPEGSFITEVPDPGGPSRVAVDSEGNLYLSELIPGGERQIRRFTPTVYKPATEEIEYAKEAVVLADQKTKKTVFLSPWVSLAIGPKDRLYVNESENITVFDSAKEGNGVLEKNILPVAEGSLGPLTQSKAIAIDLAHKRIYVTDTIPGGSDVRIFNLESPHEEVGVFDGSTTPKGEFISGEGNLALDVDETTGHVFVGDIQGASVVYELEEDGTYLTSIEHGFTVVGAGQIAVDDKPLSPNPGYLYVPSNPSGTGHVYAFESRIEEKPAVRDAAADGVTESDAVVHALINPGGLATTYRIAYISQQQYEEGGESFTNATVADEGTLPKGGEDVPVSAPASGLDPGTAYRFRVFAENAEGADEEEGAFSTFGVVGPPQPCPNDAVRLPFSAALPDCRAYELVTPPNTNGRPPTGVAFSGVFFPTLEASPDGNRVSFLIEGGTIPGYDGAGAFNGDPYLSSRGSEGWGTEITGPSGKEITGPDPGSTSPDQTYSFWEDTENLTPYVRYPDGHSAIVGRGSLANDPHIEADLITEGGGHIIFASKKGFAVPLEVNAPAAGIAAVYDRTADEVTHVVSLLPGGGTPTGEENASYLGASEEGEGIAFSIQGTIYLRLHNAETFKVAGPGSTFAGVADGGKRVFYEEGGDLFAFDAEEGKLAFSESGDVTPVNVATGGTRAYFVSPSVLTGKPNPNGEAAEAGRENLYLSEEGTISFVGLVTERDVEGEERSDGFVGGLGLWAYSLEEGKPAVDSSRTTPSGTTLLFESRADLTGFESEGFVQIYRYDATEDRLDCLSCSPTGTPPTSNASLQSISQDQPSPIPFSSFAKIANQSPDGRRAFFQTSEPLVIGDTNGEQDVYEWEGEGVGSCEAEGGCTYLISSGQSPDPNYLFAMSESGDDVFFRTSDLLLPRDAETTVSIYDARVGGGFDEPKEVIPCVEGETCRPPASSPPSLSPSGVSSKPSPGPQPQTCPKGKHKVMRHGKVTCVKNHKHSRHHHRKAGHKKRGGAR